MECERLVVESERDRELIAQHVARYDFAGQFVANRKVLDVACGSGYGSAALLRSGAKEVTGIDRDPQAISYASNCHGTSGIVFKEGKAEEIQDVEIYDVVVSFETIEHLEEPARFLEGIHRAIKHDGVFIVSSPARLRGTLNDRPVNPFHAREWNAGEFVDLLKPWFSEIDMRYQFLLKRRFPGSRMIAKSLLKMFRRQETLEFLKFPVSYAAPKGYGWFSEPAIMVALCRSPRKA